MTATETSTRALALAGENAERLGIDGRVRLEQGTVPEGGQFDLVLANLPYVGMTSGRGSRLRSPDTSRGRPWWPEPTESR